MSCAAFESCEKYFIGLAASFSISRCVAIAPHLYSGDRMQPAIVGALVELLGRLPHLRQSVRASPCVSWSALWVIAVDAQVTSVLNNLACGVRALRSVGRTKVKAPTTLLVGLGFWVKVQTHLLHRPSPTSRFRLVAEAIGVGEVPRVRSVLALVALVG